MFIPPDPTLRRPLTLTATFPLLLSYYVLAVLAILPRTFIFKLLLLPFIVWQTWRCAVELDFSVWLAQQPGFKSADGLGFWNLIFIAAMFILALRSFEWTFIKRPLRRYELPKGQDTPVERRLSISNILVDAFDLLCNTRGIGWSWSTTPFPRGSTPSPSIASISAKLLLKFTLIDASQYIIQYVCPSVKSPGGGSLFDSSLGPVRSSALAAFATAWGGMWAYATVDTVYHIATLIGRILFRQPASQWPPLMHRPWMSTSIREFWSYRWHQALRHYFIVFGARPCGALLGLPGAIMGAFGVSAVLHHLGLWGLGHGMEFSTAGGFFLFMGLGAIMEDAFKRTTGLRVQGLLGWSWTMLWTLLWGTFMLDGWARHGMFVNHFFCDQLRLGKLLVDTIIALSGK
ncbi:hypothetical protein BJV78DRAFT_1150871 [Lactifluus subvellereus]|nr:hypothetical protein BJV78DRAFT_1150871 [Lactifluus subvellereus]